MFVNSITFNFSILEKDSYIQKLPYFKIKKLDFHKKIIFITGDNGIGKTTLLEAIAYNFNLNKYGGSKNFILNKSEEPILSKYITIIKKLSRPRDAFFFRSDTFFQLEKDLTRYNSREDQYSGEKSFKEQSHGEGFMSFFKNRIGKNGLYLFDEPETALSYDNQLLFLFLLKSFENNNNQIFIVTHSPVLLSYPNAQIININFDFIGDVEYEDTSQYKNTKSFLENYKRYQKEIIKFE